MKFGPIAANFFCFLCDIGIEKRPMFYGIHGKKDRDLALERFGISQLLALRQLPVTSRKSPIKHRCRSFVIPSRKSSIPREFPEFSQRLQNCRSFLWSNMAIENPHGFFSRETPNGKTPMAIWQCVKTNSTPVVHIKIAGIYGCSSH